MVQLISDDDVFQDDNKSEASSHVSSFSEKKTSDAGAKVIRNKKTTPGGNGFH